MTDDDPLPDADGDLGREEAIVGALAELTSIRQALWSINGHLAGRADDADAPAATHYCSNCGETFASEDAAAAHGVDAHGAPDKALARAAHAEPIDS